jgi:hypothetical protein
MFSAEPIDFDPYQTAVYLENILSLVSKRNTIDGDEVDMVEENTKLALASLHKSFPNDVPNGKKVID